MAEDKGIKIPSMTERILAVFPTANCTLEGVSLVSFPGEGFSHKPQVCAKIRMGLPSGGPVEVEVFFLNGTGTPWKIIYFFSTVTEVKVLRRLSYGWRLVETLYDRLPPMSQR